MNILIDDMNISLVKYKKVKRTGCGAGGGFDIQTDRLIQSRRADWVIDSPD